MVGIWLFLFILILVTCPVYVQGSLTRASIDIICVADNDMIASSLSSVKKLGDQFVVTFAMMSHVEAFSGNNVETLVIVIRP